VVALEKNGCFEVIVKQEGKKVKAASIYLKSDGSTGRGECLQRLASVLVFRFY
jgi:hypothetical protein